MIKIPRSLKLDIIEQVAMQIDERMLDYICNGFNYAVAYYRDEQKHPALSWHDWIDLGLELRHEFWMVVMHHNEFDTAGTTAEQRWRHIKISEGVVNCWPEYDRDFRQLMLAWYYELVRTGHQFKDFPNSQSYHAT